MVEKLNKLLEQIKSAEREIKLLEEQKAAKALLLIDLKFQVKLCESLISDFQTKAVKLRCRPFSFPFHYYGGADPSNKTWKETYVKYFSPEEAFELLQGDATTYSYGYGVKYERL